MIMLPNVIFGGQDIYCLPQQEAGYQFIHVYEVHKLKVSVYLRGGEWSESVFVSEGMI